MNTVKLLSSSFTGTRAQRKRQTSFVSKLDFIISFCRIYIKCAKWKKTMMFFVLKNSLSLTWRKKEENTLKWDWMTVTREEGNWNPGLYNFFKEEYKSPKEQWIFSILSFYFIHEQIWIRIDLLYYVQSLLTINSRVSYFSTFSY